MKFLIVFFCVACASICRAEGALHKPAVLFIPDQIETQTGSGYLLKGEIGFRWDEDEPLKINVWRGRHPGERDQILGNVEIFDEQGRRLEQSFFVSLPPVPDDQITIHRGEYKRFGFFVWNGAVTFPQPGNYYVVASFNWASMGKRGVVFTAAKRWFKVVQTPPKKTTYRESFLRCSISSTVPAPR